MRFERGEGFFLGSMTLNYILTVIVYLLPILVFALAGLISTEVAVALALTGAFVFPLLLFRACRSWWLAIYFSVLPHELPVNRQEASPDEDEA